MFCLVKRNLSTQCCNASCVFSTKSRSRRGSSVVSTTSTVTSCSDDVTGKKKKSLGNIPRKRSKGGSMIAIVTDHCCNSNIYNSICWIYCRICLNSSLKLISLCTDFATSSSSGKSGKWKPISDDEFGAIRRQLFHTRHPGYQGGLCSNDTTTDLAPTAITVRISCLPLHRINEEDARKSENPFFNKTLLRERGGGDEFAMPTKRRRHLSPCRTPPHDSQQEDIEKMSPSSSSPLPSTAHHIPRTKLFVSSRGRGGRGRGRGSSRVSKISFRHRVEEGAVGERERGPRLQSRFANKHSTEGSFLKRMLDSGEFKKYL